MKKFLKTTLLAISFFLFVSVGSNEVLATNINNGLYNNIETGGGIRNTNEENKYLNQIKDNNLGVGEKGEKSVLDFLVTVARDLKTVMYIVAGVFFIIIAIRLVVSEGSDEDVNKFKNGIIWISLGIVVMQLAFYYVNILYNQDIGGQLASDLILDLFKPLIQLLETAASLFFILMAIYAFYTMVMANGDEEKAKSGKMTIFYAAIGFIVIKLAKQIVYAIYGYVDCESSSGKILFVFGGNECIAKNNLSGVTDIIVKVINWMNSFVGIAIIIMIIYAGVMILFSNGDEEKLNKAKKSIIYIVIGMGILVMNYLIMTFFILPEVGISKL